jgi:hypothetical protein
MLPKPLRHQRAVLDGLAVELDAPAKRNPE